MRFWAAVMVAVAFAALGCFGGKSSVPTTPGEPREVSSTSSSHHLWGLWRFIADPAAGTVEVVPLRTSDFHANVVKPFLEPPSGPGRLTISNVVFGGMICDVDVTLIHPFPGLSEYTGFDVAGIMIGSGTKIGFHDPDLVMAGEGDTRILNADGYTRWWNPVEFPVNTGTILAYNDGRLGVPHSKAGYDCTINGYKLFGDDLDPEDDVLDLGASNRVVFSSSVANTRHYTIDFEGGLAFNYAVDANWEPPGGDPPYEPDDFPPEANRAEAWAVSITEAENTLWHDGGESGGDLSLVIDVWDHYKADLNTVWVDSPGNCDPVFSSTPVGGGDGYSTYAVDIIDTTPPVGSMQLLIGIECEEEGYWDILPGEPLTGYFTCTAAVGGPGITVISPNGGEIWEGLTSQDITWQASGDIDFVDLYYSKDHFVSDINLIEANVPNTGVYDWLVPDDPSETVKVKVVESGGGLEDESDDYFTILEGMCDFGSQGFQLEQTYQWVPECHPWYSGIEVTRQDQVQRLIMRSSGNGHFIRIYNASDPLAGPVASYDAGDFIYCNNDQAIWIDSISGPGIDRIAYNTFGSGSPSPGYQLHTVDWNGTGFVSPQTLPKSGSIWLLCFTPDGDIIVKNAQAWEPSFYFYDKSDNYNFSFLFQLHQTDFDYGNSGTMREMVYNPELDAVMIFSLNDDVSVGGQLFVVDMEGNLLFEDLEVFDVDPPNQIAWRVGIDIDLEDPDCRIVLYGDELNLSSQSVVWHFARYSADLEEKEVYQQTSTYNGPCRGDLQSDGTLWASAQTGYAHIHKFTPPPDW